MVKFSIIIPIYNVEQYLKKCLDSVINQSYKNYECILVCDVSSDNSTKIARDYYIKDKRFKIIKAINTGLSEARNIGVNASSGEYILFLDGDDYYESDLLEIINKNLSDNPDLLRFQVRKVYSNKKIDYNEIPFYSIKGIEAFNKIIDYNFIENAWAYCYNAKFYRKYKFKFMKDRLAEDFGLLPLIIAKANKIKSINYIGYNYVQRGNSLMSNQNYNHKIKKMEDMIIQAKNLHKEFNNINENYRFLEFINNSLIYYSTTLKYKDFKKYKKIIYQLNVYDYIPNNNMKRKIKKKLIEINAYIYYNYIARFL